jgi:hypothetical protein
MLAPAAAVLPAAAAVLPLQLLLHVAALSGAIRILKLGQLFGGVVSYSL